MIMFCLIFSLHIPHGNQNPSFFPVEGSVSIKISVSTKIHISKIFHYKKLFWHFFSCDCTIVMADVNKYYIVCLSLTGPKVKFSVVPQIYYLLWESQQKTHIFAQWNMAGHWLFASEPIGNLFYLDAVMFEIRK